MKPTEEKDERGNYVSRHPAFAQIGVSRVSGTTHLYGSDFKHNQFVVITLRDSEEHWTNGGKWHFGRRELVSVAMTEAQSATTRSMSRSLNLKRTIVATLTTPSKSHSTSSTTL
jgi:hypothetical protein